MGTDRARPGLRRRSHGKPRADCGRTSSTATRSLVPLRHRSVRLLLCKSPIFMGGGVPQGHDNLPCDRSRRSESTILRCTRSSGPENTAKPFSLLNGDGLRELWSGRLPRLTPPSPLFWRHRCGVSGATTRQEGTAWVSCRPDVRA